MLELVASVEASATVVDSVAATVVASAGDPAVSVEATEVASVEDPVVSVAETEVASVEHHVADTEVSLN